MKFNIISDTNKRIPRRRILELLALIDEDEEPPDSLVNIVFIRDPKIKTLNKRFRNIARPTDVLSFNIDEEPGVNNIFGEIYISTDTALKNARMIGHGYYDELLRLCCHGYLHLMGYDHVKESEKRTMESRENYYLGLT